MNIQRIIFFLNSFFRDRILLVFLKNYIFYYAVANELVCEYQWYWKKKSSKSAFGKKKFKAEISVFLFLGSQRYTEFKNVFKKNPRVIVSLEKIHMWKYRFSGISEPISVRKLKFLECMSSFPKKNFFRWIFMKKGPKNVFYGF